MNNPNEPCIFCNTLKKDFIFENDLAFASLDSYPVSKFHSLIIPKKHKENYFDLDNDEILACNNLILKIKKKIQNDDKSVLGFNMGINSGIVAGQSILHCHIHLIPRRVGDVENPQAGVRGVNPSKQHYVRKSK